jgi:probable HAF family extracellular repeat protein
MRRICERLSLAAMLFLFFSVGPFALSQGAYTQINPPGSIFTLANGIDAGGDVVGSYEDASYVTHAFLFHNGSYTTVDYPGAQLTYFDGINDLGTQIVGGTESSGFQYNVQTQTFSALINYPGSSYTAATAINSAGIIVGYYADKNGGHETEYGFELVGSTFSSISPPRATSTQAFGVTESGIVVGNSNRLPNFLFYEGGLAQLTIPNLPEAQVLGISPLGSGLVGRAGEAGFLFAKSNDKLFTLDYPGADSTYAWGVNDAGAVTGYYTDSEGYHGFTWMPPAAGAGR